MKTTIKLTMWILFVFTFLLVACTSSIPAEKVCKVDADCVPNKCCGADDGVNIENGPDCEGILCTAVCNPETIDCGNGQIKCVNKECKAVFN